MPSPLTGVVRLVILELDDSPLIFTDESIDSGEKCADDVFNSCKAFSASLLSLVCISNAALIAMLLDVAVTVVGVVGIAFAFAVVVTPVTVAIPFAAVAAAAADVDVEVVVRSCEMLDSWLCTFDSKLLHLPMTLIISSRLLLIFCFINAKRFPGGLVNVVRPQLLQIGVAGLFER